MKYPQHLHSFFVFIAPVMIAACASTTIVDSSMSAFAAGDFTLPGSVCAAVPGGGVDSCQVTEGTEIVSAWTLVVPKPGNAAGVTGGTVDVYFKDIHKAYGVTDWTLQVPWKDFFGGSTWDSSYDGEVLALLTLNWTDNAGLHQIMQARGLAVIIVTKPGYNRIPINSGNAAWSTDCHIDISTAGRSALQCL